MVVRLSEDAALVVERLARVGALVLRPRVPYRQHPAPTFRRARHLDARKRYGKFVYERSECPRSLNKCSISIILLPEMQTSNENFLLKSQNFMSSCPKKLKSRCILCRAWC